ncbi:hypothetical protein [Pectobacterium parmentieri]|nr:hypothetical protein [Pectobacterium parmentieri]
MKVKISVSQRGEIKRQESRTAHSCLMTAAMPELNIALFQRVIVSAD